ncbi:G2-specific serine/threonine protein kinase [Imshaugia aleurites]|uniref:non-specific serine/threonine protein kinase n=1 Tax=Imshaugia aleurites TaxID=172621 RepID=A0A8H3FAK1_9LECA|nr:G2-specific serine/threonine protein kinase [Imshaugia aleurites]
MAYFSRTKRAQTEPIRERGIREPSATYDTNGAVIVKEYYDQIRKIGEGGQGKLWIVKRKSDRKILVRKTQKRFSMFGSIPCEMHIFENVLTSHPRILEFDHANYAEACGSLVLYFEHCQGGDLSEYVPGGGQSGASEKFIWQCFVQLADALAFLHYGYDRFAKYPDTPPRSWRRIVHRDIKPGNVFLRRKLTSANPVPQIVLGDFGLATLDGLTYGGGTDEWIGPEIPVMTKETDVWGLGAIIHALAHGKGPVSWPPRDWPKGKKAASQWYSDPRARQPKPLPTRYSMSLDRNMMDCLIMDPSKRISSLQLVKNLELERPKAFR